MKEQHDVYRYRTLVLLLPWGSSSTERHYTYSYGYYYA